MTSLSSMSTIKFRPIVLSTKTDVAIRWQIIFILYRIQYQYDRVDDQTHHLIAIDPWERLYFVRWVRFCFCLFLFCCDRWSIDIDTIQSRQYFNCPNNLTSSNRMDRYWLVKWSKQDKVHSFTKLNFSRSHTTCFQERNRGCMRWGSMKAMVFLSKLCFQSFKTNAQAEWSTQRVILYIFFY